MHDAPGLEAEWIGGVIGDDRHAGGLVDRLGDGRARCDKRFPVGRRHAVLQQVLHHPRGIDGCVVRKRHVHVGVGHGSGPDGERATCERRREWRRDKPFDECRVNHPRIAEPEDHQIGSVAEFLAVGSDLAGAGDRGAGWAGHLCVTGVDRRPDRLGQIAGGHDHVR